MAASTSVLRATPSTCAPSAAVPAEHIDTEGRTVAQPPACPTLLHQIARISPGRHRSPADGVSVTELASMLAGEPFTDRPRSVCPVLAAFLSVYNDLIDDDRRRDLYRYAAAIVGTRSSAEVTLARAERALEWARAGDGGPARFPLLAWLVRRPLGEPPPDPLHAEEAGAFAARSAVRERRRGHADALLLVDEMIALEPTPAGSLLPLHLEVADVAPASRAARGPMDGRMTPAGHHHQHRLRRDVRGSARRRGRAHRGAPALVSHGLAHPICAVRGL